MAVSYTFPGASTARAAQRLTLAVAVTLVAIGCGDSPTSPSSVSNPDPLGAGSRQFSGMVNLPAPTTMDVSLRMENRAANVAPVRPTFVATLTAQENGTVTGDYTLHTAPPRQGQISGSFASASFLTAGNFDGTLTEATPGGCIAQRRYSGPATAAGINWVGGQMMQQCPSAPFDGLDAVVISAVDGTTVTDPAPDTDPGQAPTLTIALDGTGDGSVTSEPGGITSGADCSEAFDADTEVVLTPTAAARSTFTGWSGGADCADGTVTLSANRSCTATFDLDSSGPSRRVLTITLSGTPRANNL